MSIRIWPRNRWLRGLVLGLAVLILPYVFSRMASPWREVAIHSVDDVGQNELPKSELRIASYNIAHGRGIAESNWDGGNRVERAARLDAIADLLREIDADIVVLNEVDFDASWSDSVNQARYLAKKAGYSYWVEQRNMDFRILHRTWRFGNAVLSKYPIVDARAVELPSYSTWETVFAGKKRGIDCDIDVGHQKIRILGVHLSHRSESVRVDSARLLGEIAAASDVPTIIAGDLNSTPVGFPESVSDADGNNAIGALDGLGVFQRSPTAAPVKDRSLTFHAVKPTCVIDWILIPRDWHFVKYTVEASRLSDHRPVHADVATRPDD